MAFKSSEKVAEKNKGVLEMGKKKLHEFAKKPMNAFNQLVSGSKQVAKRLVKKKDAE